MKEGQSSPALHKMGMAAQPMIPAFRRRRQGDFKIILSLCSRLETAKHGLWGQTVDSDSDSVAMWFYVSQLTSLSFSVLIYKMGRVVVSVWWLDKMIHDRRWTSIHSVYLGTCIIIIKEAAQGVRIMAHWQSTHLSGPRSWVQFQHQNKQLTAIADNIHTQNAWRKSPVLLVFWCSWGCMPIFKSINEHGRTFWKYTKP